MVSIIRNFYHWIYPHSCWGMEQIPVQRMERSSGTAANSAVQHGPSPSRSAPSKKQPVMVAAGGVGTVRQGVAGYRPAERKLAGHR